MKRILWKRQLVICALYTVGAVVFLWPMPAHLQTAVWGDRFDAWTTLWLIWHLGERLVDGDFNAWTPLIQFPRGYDLWSFGHAGVQAIGGVMTALGVPLVAAYNLLLIGGVATSGLAAHALGWTLTRSHAAGAVAGIVFATSPYFYGEGGAGCIELVAAGFLPLHALLLVRLARKPDLRRTIAAALGLAIIGPFNWYYALFAAIFGAGFWTWQLLGTRRPNRRALVCIAASLALGAALDVPLIKLAAQETPTRPAYSAEMFTDAELLLKSSEVMNGQVPLDALNVELLETVDALQVGINSTPVNALIRGEFALNPLRSTPGAIAFIIGLAGWVAAGRRGHGWAALTAGALTLTLGPYLNLDGDLGITDWAAQIPLPYHWAHEWVPFFSKAYRPYRIGVLALQCLAVLGALGFAVLQPRFGRQLTVALPGALALLAFTQPHWSGERLATRDLADTAVPPLYDAFDRLKPGAIIETPLHYQPITVGTSKLQYYQRRHRRPMLNSNQLIRRPDLLDFKRYVLSNPFLTTLLDQARKPVPDEVAFEDLEDLRRDGFRYIVAHRRVPADRQHLAGDVVPADLLTEPNWTMLRQVLGPPAEENAWGVIYEIPQSAHPQPEAPWNELEVEDLSLPIDIREYGLPVSLNAGQSVELFDGIGTKLCFWAHPLGEEDELNARVTTAEVETLVPLSLSKGHWTWIEIELPSENTEVALVPRSDAASAEIMRVQVVR